MMAEQPIWWDYAIFGRYGITGEMLPDTPQHIREEYEAYLALVASRPEVRF